MSITAQNTSDSRMISLCEWLASLPEFHLDTQTLRPASSDASFRRYFRVDSPTGTYIVMDAPPDKEKVEPFIHVADIFGQSGVAVPKVQAKNIEKGFLLLSDLGVTTYLNELNDETANKLYLDAIDALISIQSISQPDVLPEYDRAALLRELDLFPEWYIGKHLNVQMSEKQKAELDKVFKLILANNLSQPQVYVHRDYHSRNLMRLGQNDNSPGILDFQDALFGPITYDLVSLLKDACI